MSEWLSGMGKTMILVLASTCLATVNQTVVRHFIADDAPPAPTTENPYLSAARELARDADLVPTVHRVGYCARFEQLVDWGHEYASAWSEIRETTPARPLACERQRAGSALIGDDWLD